MPARRILLALAVVAATVASTGTPADALGTPVADTVITFESETGGAKPNGYTVAGAPKVHFQDTNGTGLFVGAFGTQGEGNRSLLVSSDFDDSGVRILLDQPTNRISMRLGNDDPFYTEPGDEAVLTVYRGTKRVGETRLTLNRNDVMDQTISYDHGALFNRVVIKYDVVPSKGVSEVIDRIVIGPLCTIAGTEGPDTLTGTPGNDVICGGGGNDTIYGRAGNDHLSGGNGNDLLFGEGGEDFIAGNYGNDTIRGGDADDHLQGGEHDDKLYGEAGNDTLLGAAGRDLCDGGQGRDTARTDCETRVAVP